MKKYRSSNDLWYLIDNSSEVFSPALLVYPDRIDRNIQKMVEMAGNVNQIRPHVKTHKMAEVIKMQMKRGIYKFKCATISETEMVAGCGATDILLAIQPVGPNLLRFFKLKQAFPGTKISCIADSEEVILKLSEMAKSAGVETTVWLDLNIGMDRTGILPGEDAARLYKLIFDLPMLSAEGLHAYDGHIREKDLSMRKIICDESFAPVINLANKLKDAEIDPVKIVAGGSPTFPIHALRQGVESSPGTTLLWDYGHSNSFSDMEFLPAAVLLMRIISKPSKDLLCLDLGHKAVASEMPQPRIKIMGLENYVIISHSEEHLVIRSSVADSMNIGDTLYGIPWHICPTVDRHDSATVVIDHQATGQWNIEARKRKITF